jgi:A118 family predicted phage portal protein
MKEIVKYLRGRGFDCVDDDFYAQIALWAKWYRGKVPMVHNYTQYNGRKKLHRTRKTLGMAKTVAEDWANLLLNEKAQISVGNERAQKRIDEILRDNCFRMRANQLVELAFAMGTGAFVEYTQGGRVCIDYIRAGMIYPIAWDNGTVTQCAFASERAKGKEKRVYLNIHRLEGGKYVIENRMFRRNGSFLTEIPLDSDILPEVRTESSVPRFQILKPSIANNISPDCPMGISVYGNALDPMEHADLVFDSYNNEFRLGKKRITVPVSMARMAMEEDGTVNPVFDDNDTEFYALPMDDSAENKITEHNMEIRADAHEKGVQTALNLVSWKCGLGVKRYSFQDVTVRTATEVISSRSDTYQNLCKHELLIESALIGLVSALADIEDLGELDTSIVFDDSILQDSDAQRERDRQDVRDGIMKLWEYRVKWYGEDEETAKAVLAQGDTTAMQFGAFA